MTVSESPQWKKLRPTGRRAIIAAALMFLIGTTVWWNWPRGDPRFIGRWELWRQNHLQPSFVLQMSRNGGGRATHLPNMRSTSLTWRVQNETLILGHGSPETATGIIVAATNLIRNVIGWDLWLIAAEEWQIVSAERDMITIRPFSSSETMTLRRILE